MKRNIFLLLFSAAVLFGAVGCDQEEPQKQIDSELFKPVEPGERMQRYCQVLCLNSEDGELSPVEQQIFDELQGDGQKKISKESLDKLASDTKEKMLDLSIPKPIEQFMQLSRNIPDKVVAAMTDANIRNLSVFLVKMENNYYAIRTFEYIGKNYEQDWLNLNRDPNYTEWNNECEKFQIPIVGKSEEGGLIQWAIAGNEIMYLPLNNENKEKQDEKEEKEAISN